MEYMGTLLYYLPNDPRNLKLFLKWKEVYLQEKSNSPGTTLWVNLGTLVWETLGYFTLFPINACRMSGLLYVLGDPTELKMNLNCLSWALMPPWDTFLPSHLAQDLALPQQRGIGHLGNRAPEVWAFQVKAQGEPCVDQRLFTPYTQSGKKFTQAKASKRLLSGSQSICVRNPETKLNET